MAAVLTPRRVDVATLMVDDILSVADEDVGRAIALRRTSPPRSGRQ